jgi:lipid-A-disaccharide synthase
MVIAYRLGALSYFLIMRVVKTKYATLFNIAAQEFVAPELIQDRCTGEQLAAELKLRLDDAALREQQVRRQFDALDKMGRGLPDPAEKAADAVLGLLTSRRDGMAATDRAGVEGVSPRPPVA